MRILVLGGSQFVGRAFVAAALARGDEVTTFNRGKSAVDPPGVETLRGDREVAEDLAHIVADGRGWDAIVDTCGYTPSVVAMSAKALSGHAHTYLYVSSLAAIRDWGTAASVDDESPLKECPPDAKANDGDYGTLKAGCERAIEQHFSGRCLYFRAGIIVGPHDNDGAMDAWLWRMHTAAVDPGARQVLAPGNPEIGMRLIDARDVATFGLHCLAERYAGSFVVVPPRRNTTYGAMLAACAAATKSAPELVWVDDDFLLSEGVGVWSDLPMWIPDTPEARRVWATEAARAAAAGLHCRPFTDTMRDTWTVLRESTEPTLPIRNQHGASYGLGQEREHDLLKAWESNLAT